MKNHTTAFKSIVKKITISAAILTAGLTFTFAEVSHGDVKFSKPVVVLKGTVHSAETGKVMSVKISVRSAENTNEEITSSVSNSESGNYLVILSSNTNYVVRLQNPEGVMKEETIRTPVLAGNTIEVNKDFTIKTK